MSKTIRIPYIGDAHGQCAVLPSEERIQREAKYAENVFPSDDGSTPLSDRIEQMIESARELGELKYYETEMRAYTYGEKLEATRKSSNFVGGELIVDPTKLNLSLLSIVTGKPTSELESLSIPIAQALFDEMGFMNEPNPDRLLFLLRKPIPGESAVQKKAKK